MSKCKKIVKNIYNLFLLCIPFSGVYIFCVPSNSEKSGHIFLSYFTLFWSHFLHTIFYFFLFTRPIHHKLFVFSYLLDIKCFYW